MTYFIIQVEDGSLEEARAQVRHAKKDGYASLWLTEDQCDGNGIIEVLDIRELPEDLIAGNDLELIFEEDKD